MAMKSGKAGPQGEQGIGPKQEQGHTPSTAALERGDAEAYSRGVSHGADEQYQDLLISSLPGQSHGARLVLVVSG